MVLKVAVPARMIAGDVDEGYGKVADVFRANFAAGREVGAAVAIYRDGVKVVDLWGGYRNGLTKKPWRRDTMVNVFSTTKGVAALVVALAESRGLLSYDAKVADYWPEFAEAGKGDVTVRQLLGHQAGLAALKPVPTLADVADPTKLSKLLAAQTPAWRPGTRQGYHSISLGWYQSELIRRTDPAARTLGSVLADEIVKPLGLDLYIGLPDTVDRDRLAYLHGWRRPEGFLHLNAIPARFLVAALNPIGLTAKSMNMPRGINAYNGDYNRDDIREVEIPSANGIGTARSFAQMYGSAAVGGAELGLNGATFDALAARATVPNGNMRDKVLNVDAAYLLGFSKPVPHFRFGSSDKAFGTPGLGGSFGFADPDTGVGFAYVTNQLGFRLWSDPRELALRQTLFRDILGTHAQT